MASCLTHGSPSAVPSVGEDTVWGRRGARAAGRCMGRTGALLARGVGKVKDRTQLWLPEAGLETLAPSLSPEGLVAVRSPFPLCPPSLCFCCASSPSGLVALSLAGSLPGLPLPGVSLAGNLRASPISGPLIVRLGVPGPPHHWAGRRLVQVSVSHSCRCCSPDPSGLSSSEFLALGWSREPARGGEHGSPGLSCGPIRSGSGR